MKIPRNLKPGDRLWYSKTEYATVAPGELTKLVYQAATDFHVDGIMAKVGKRSMRYRLKNGVEVQRDTPPIVRIERIASAKPKTVAQRQLAAAKDHLRRKMEGEGKRGKVDRDAAFKKRAAGFIRTLADTYSEKEYYQNKPIRKTLRAIARRLDGAYDRSEV